MRMLNPRNIAKILEVIDTEEAVITVITHLET
jgi:hypothetical protein